MTETMAETPQARPAAEEPGLWAPPRGEPRIGAADLAAWRAAVADLRALAGQESLSKSEVARRSAVPIGTLSPWYDGGYTGRYDAVTERVRRFLAAHAEARSARLVLPAAPDFVETPTARRLTEALVYAQTMPEIAVATLGAGCGKTSTARAYVAARPNAWGLRDEEVRRLCVAIARREGALRLVDKAIKLAAMMAAGEGREIGAADLRAAWANRTAAEAAP